jgi:hypothetical protein
MTPPGRLPFSSILVHIIVSLSQLILGGNMIYFLKDGFYAWPCFPAFLGIQC